MSDPDDLSQFSGPVFFIDFRARRQHRCSSVKPAFDVWSRTFALTASPEVHFVARSEMCQRPCFSPEMLSSVLLPCVLSVTRLRLLPALADVPETSDPEFLCHCRRMVDPSSANVPVPCERKRNHEPAPISLCDNTAAANTTMDSRSSLSSAILVIVSFTIPMVFSVTDAGHVASPG